MNQQLLNFENNEYDINGLFNIQINFEQLKFLMTAITKTVKKANERIADLEDKINSKDKKIDEVEKLSNNQDNFLSTKFHDYYSTKSLEQSGKEPKVNFSKYFIYLLLFI